MNISKMIFFGTLIVAANVNSAFADGSGQYYGHGMMGGNWFFGPLMFMLLTAFVVGAVFLINRLIGPQANTRSLNSSLDILKERFARGDIDQEEFETRRRILSE